MSSSALKWSLATEWGVGMGFSGISGDKLRRGDRPDLALLTLLEERMLAVLLRRDGVIPLPECSEFMDALRSRVGVLERDEDETTEAEVLRSGLRIALSGRLAVGDWSVTCLGGADPVGRAERGVLVGEEVAMDRRWRDWAKFPSLWPSLCRLDSSSIGVDIFRLCAVVEGGKGT